MDDFTSWKEKNKALWERVYDEIFLPNLEAEWTKRIQKCPEESGQNEEHQQLPQNHVEGQETVNTSFEIKDQQPSGKPQGRNGFGASKVCYGNFNGEEATVSADEYRRLSERFNELSKKYQDMSQKVKYLEKKNAAVMQKNKDMKESVRAWQEYVHRQGRRKAQNETKIKDEPSKLPTKGFRHDTHPHIPFLPNLEAPAGIPSTGTTFECSSPSPPDPLKPSAFEAYDLSIFPDPSPRNENTNSKASITPKAIPRHHTQYQDESYSRSHSNYPQQGSSQTTEDERSEEAKSNRKTIDEVDEDVPEFVSARSLKRKRGRQKPNFEVFADQSVEGTSEKPFHVKEELLSSPLIGTHGMMREEPVDLDAPTPNVLRTPRHPRRKPSLHSNTTGTLHHQRSNSAPFTQGIKRECSMMATDHADFDEMEQNVAAEFRACSEPSDPAQNDTNILQPLDVNAVVEVPKDYPNKRIRRSGVPQEAGHDVLAESGEARPPIDIDKFRLPPHMARAELNRKLLASKTLQTSLDDAQEVIGPSLAKTALKQIASPSNTYQPMITPSRRTELHNKTSTDPSMSRDNLELDDRPIWMMRSNPQPRSSTRKAPTQPSKQQKRLRKKPLAELGINDFKPNPTYNQGYSYAFSETLRKRGDRMCVPGCTNLQCCGSTFRVFAEAQAPLSTSQEETLLEECFGDAYSHMQMTQISREERTELVLQARTKKMANEIGKHREAYGRSRTPPGFWRLDFPTTQEQQEDREKSKEQEKTVIHERWLEAQKKGGKWLFRDE